MWQKTVKPLVDAGTLQVLGVVQEQHPDRAKLYRQWRGLNWPLYIDSLNLLDIKVVPIPVAIDEYGIVRHESLWPGQLASEFVEVNYPQTQVEPNYNVVKSESPSDLQRLATANNHSQAWSDLADACFLAHQSAMLSPGHELEPARSHQVGETGDCDAVQAYEKAIELDSQVGRLRFRLGVALRARYESRHRQANDAQRAVEQWGYALAADPNQYIWRRRLQQYGPRLDKPYNFYFWVKQARTEIRARGDTPLKLAEEPSGSELAPPVHGIGVKGQADSSDQKATHTRACDLPAGRIAADSKRFVEIETIVTPARVRPGHRVRVRVVFRLNNRSNPYWNNEADDLAVCLELPDQVILGEGELAFPGPAAVESQERRAVEFELSLARKTAAGAIDIPARALYYVCEDKGGKCHYVRQSFAITLQVDPDAPMLR